MTVRWYSSNLSLLSLSFLVLSAILFHFPPTSFHILLFQAIFSPLSPFPCFYICRRNIIILKWGFIYLFICCVGNLKREQLEGLCLPDTVSGSGFRVTTHMGLSDSCHHIQRISDTSMLVVSAQDSVGWDVGVNTVCVLNILCKLIFPISDQSSWLV